MLIYNILIIIIVCLLSWQLYLEMFQPYLIEGMDSNTVTYQDYSSTDPATNSSILSQQNAGNIAFLKQQIDDLLPLKQQVADLTDELNTMSTQLDQLAQQQADYATLIVGGTTTPPQITGTDYSSDTTTGTTTGTTTTG